MHLSAFILAYSLLQYVLRGIPIHPSTDPLLNSLTDLLQVRNENEATIKREVARAWHRLSHRGCELFHHSARCRPLVVQSRY